MLTRLIRIQLVLFTIGSIVGISVMVVNYVQAPTLLGIGRITVTLELPAAGGLYTFGNVTYRGSQVGKVTALKLSRRGAVATLSLVTSPKIPADLQAEIRSVSAVGEQYVDLLPRSDSGPYLENGSIIPLRDITLPQPVGPILDRTQALVDSIPQGKLGELVDESFRAFNGAGYDLGSLLDSSATITRDANGVADQFRTLLDDSVPLVDAQVESIPSARVWTRSLAGVSQQLVEDDSRIRALLGDGPKFAQEVSQLLNQVKPTLPVLLANLRVVGQIAVTYNPALEQLLVLLPPYVASTQSQSSINNPTGLPLGDFAMAIGDPPPCTVGYLPPSAWRPPSDVSDIDTPDGLYCKLPQDSPSAVRGARNYPCLSNPGKRAPTVEICNSDKPFEPLAMRNHITGPYPLDPNLVAQGIPPDDRANPSANIYGPLEGTPRPPPLDAGAPPSAAVPAPPAAGGSDGVSTAAPSAYRGAEARNPSVVVAQYDPWSGRYMAGDGQLYRNPDLVAGGTKTWKDMLPT